MRINTKSGNFEFYPLSIQDFKGHPNQNVGVDVSIMPCEPDRNKYDYSVFGHKMILTEDVIEKYNIGIGNELVVAGLFQKHYGTKKNQPIVRVGNIAAMSDSDEPIKTKKFGDMPCYLIELRSLEGLSGSPVFVYLHDRILNGKVATIQGGQPFYLLGILHGHWNLKNTENPMDETGEINSGIGIVVSAIRIIETLE